MSTPVQLSSSMFVKWTKKLHCLRYALPCIAIWAVYLVAFWPGLMSPDSIAQWDQVLQTSFSNNYPAFHTLTNWLITRIWLSPAAVAVAQIIALACVFSLTIHELELWGVGPRIRALVTAVFCLSPVNGMLVITLWKDIPYTSAMLGLFMVVLRMVRTEGRWLQTAPGMVTLWLVLLLVSLFRHNGVLMVGLFLVFMLIVWRTVCFKQLLRVSVRWILVFIIITVPVYRLIGVAPMAKFFARQNLMHQIGAMIHHGVIESRSDLSFLALIQPIDGWVKYYNCYSLNVLVYNEHVQHQFLESHADQLVDIWKRSILRHLDVVWEHQKCVTSLLWQITEPQSREGRLYTTELKIVENDFNLQTQSLWPRVHDIIYYVVNLSHSPNLIWFLWRPAFYLYGLLLCVCLAAIRRKNISILQVALPAVLNSIVWLAVITTQDFRFQYPVYVMALIAPALLFVPQQPSPSQT
jgi:hypothetical protein